MKLYWHSFGIYSDICRMGGRIFMIPELCTESEDARLISKIGNKAVDGNGGEIEYCSGLILKDRSLIGDLSEEDVYLAFVAAPQPYMTADAMPYQEKWDTDFSADDLCFLGWTVNNHADSAATDGIFPILMEDYIEDNELKGRLKVCCQDDLNCWGLLPDEETCQKYLRKNIDDVMIRVAGEPVKTDWQPLAVYCDRFTFAKLEGLIARNGL